MRPGSAPAPAEPERRPVKVAMTETWRLGDLRPLPYNPRTITPKEAADLDEGLERFGMVEDLVVNVHPGREGNVVGGFQRLQLLLRRGVEEVSCKVVSLPEEAERELNIRLNANGGRWDPRLLVDGFSREELEEWGLRDAELEDFDRTAAQIAEELAAEAPPEFPEIDEDLETEHECPKCGYRWSGSTAARSPEE